MNCLYKYFFILLTTVLLFNGCEDEIGSGNLPYEEKIVVRGVLQAGDRIERIFIGRTLPYIQRFTSNPDALITDAIVTVTCNDTIYPLRYSTTGFYFTNALIVTEGTTYKLRVEWNGKIAESITTVPYSPVIDTVLVTHRDIADSKGGEYIEYTFTWNIHSRKNNVIYLMMSLFEGRVFLNTNDSVVGMRFSEKYVISKAYPEGDGIVISAQAFDFPFYAYYLTFSNTMSDDYTSSPSPVAWNVTGDAIGMFMGASRVETKLPDFE